MQATQPAAPIGGVSAQVEEIPASREVLMQDWLDWMQHRQLSPNTIKLYTRTVAQAWADIDLLAADDALLEKWVRERGGRAGTIANRIVALTCFYRFLVKTKRVAVNPAADLDRPRQRRGVPKPVEDLEAVLEALDQADAKANTWGSNPRRVGETRDMAVFLANTGLRIHEAVALNVELPVGRSITIVGKGAKEAIVPINPKAREALENLGGKWPIGARATQRRFEKAGIHPHQLRHTFATALIRKGYEIGTVSKLCRHSSPTVTMVYASYAQDMLEAAVDSL